MSCILRISGESLDIEALLSKFPLPADRTWKKGGKRSLKGKFHADSGVNFIASEAELDEFNQQVEEATAYLQAHEAIISNACFISWRGMCCIGFRNLHS